MDDSRPEFLASNPEAVRLAVGLDWLQDQRDQTAEMLYESI